MKLRYLTLAGLLIATLGCFLPFEVQDGSVHSLFPAWYIPALGLSLFLLSKDGPSGNGRVLGGLVGILMGIITVFWAITPSVLIEKILYQGPVTILIGSILACIGGFSGYKRTSSLDFHLATILALMAIWLIFISMIVSSLPQIWLVMPSFENIFIGFVIFCLLVILGGSIAIVGESRRTIQ